MVVDNSKVEEEELMNDMTRKMPERAMKAKIG
jgi:hypothetical protein